ncbi:hypothetical protein TRFO_39124 [Tritrichomonas foetus]|uniref:Uncharacterized protein n=1 Tax=Tritrichomonas foetus TaxID=1144522 RepID=A0A1J4JBS2_9EUKA|nr:hypothetical protein TRFO_39124 [Tritrichomonas foetus]|eukprot:OHS94700.1 hypothetical protein TRFO_39124 [Tritrichomonas foetus]
MKNNYYNKLTPKRQARISRCFDIIRMIVYSNPEDDEILLKRLLTSNYAHNSSRLLAFIYISINICSVWPNYIDHSANLLSLMQKSADPNNNCLIYVKKFIGNQLFQKYFGDSTDDIYIFVLHFFLKCIEKGIYSTEEIVSKIKRKFVRKKVFFNQLCFFFIFFAPEIEETDKNFYEETQNFIDQSKTKQFLNSKLSFILDEVNYQNFKKDNWKKLKKERVSFAQIENAIRNDDLDSFKRIIESENNGDLNGYCKNSIFSPFVLFDNEFPFICSAAIYGSEKIFMFLFKSGVSLESRSKSGISLFQCACVNPVSSILSVFPDELIHPNLNSSTAKSPKLSTSPLSSQAIYQNTHKGSPNTNSSSSSNIYSPYSSSPFAVSPNSPQSFKENFQINNPINNQINTQITGQMNQSCNSNDHIMSSFARCYKLDELNEYLYLACNDKLGVAPNGTTAFNKAIYSSNYFIFKMCLEKNVDINLEDGFGMTPFECACYGGDYLCMKNLYKLGADVKKGKPMIYATEFGNYFLIPTLLKYHEIDPDQLYENATPLKMAILNSHFKVVKLLINDKRVNVNRIFNDGQNYINVAACQNDIRIMQLILNKLSFDSLNEMKVSPLLNSIVYELPEMTNFLLSLDQINPNKLFNNVDISALWIATKVKNTKIIEMLIEKTVKVTVPDIILAYENNDSDLVDLLTKYFSK